jgi:hypothetical protein
MSYLCGKGHWSEVKLNRSQGNETEVVVVRRCYARKLRGKRIMFKYKHINLVADMISFCVV